MDSTLEVRVQGKDLHGHTMDTGVSMADRLWDALAGLLVLSGITLFVMARNGLASLAAGTHDLPPGVTSYVQRADYFSAQSSLGLTLVGIGVAVGIAAAVRHARRRRPTTTRIPATARPATPIA